jgi:hypothetical protein
VAHHRDVISSKSHDALCDRRTECATPEDTESAEEGARRDGCRITSEDQPEADQLEAHRQQPENGLS